MLETILDYSWVAAPAAVWLFERIMYVLSPGAPAKSRWTYAVLGLAMSAIFLWAGLGGGKYILGLALSLAALFFAMRVLEQEHSSDAVGFSGFSALAIFFELDFAALLALPALAVLLDLRRRRQWVWSVGAVLVFAAFCWVVERPMLLFSGPGWQDWSALNFFKTTFERGGGTESNRLPNIIFVLFPLAHPAFCFTLPALFLLFKKTDVHLYAKRVLALSLLVYLLYVGGLPTQDYVRLLPAYVLLLLLLFPAWDRFFAYGLYFFPRLAYALMTLTVVCHVLFVLWL